MSVTQCPATVGPVFFMIGYVGHGKSGVSRSWKNIYRLRRSRNVQLWLVMIFFMIGYDGHGMSRDGRSWEKGLMVGYVGHGISGYTRPLIFVHDRLCLSRNVWLWSAMEKL